MKFSKLSQLVLVSAIGLILATYFTACDLVTIDYVFVACSAGSSPGSAGQIYTYAVDSQSGALRTVASPVVLRRHRPHRHGHHFRLFQPLRRQQGQQLRGSLRPSTATAILIKKDSITLANVPVSIAVNAAGTYLYVVSGTSPPPRSLSTPSAPAPSAPAAATHLTYSSRIHERHIGSHRRDRACQQQCRLRHCLRQVGLQSRRNHHQQRQSRLAVWVRCRFRRRFNGCLGQPLSVRRQTFRTDQRSHQPIRLRH